MGGLHLGLSYLLSVAHFSFIFYAVIFGLRSVLVLWHGMFSNALSSLNFVKNYKLLRVS